MNQRDEPDLGDVLVEARIHTIQLTLRKETKHTFVYGTDDEGAFASSVYISKASLPKPAPKRVRLTMEVLV